MAPLDGRRRHRKDGPSPRRRRPLQPASAVVVAAGSQRPSSLEMVRRTVIEPALLALTPAAWTTSTVILRRRGHL